MSALTPPIDSRITNNKKKNMKRRRKKETPYLNTFAFYSRMSIRYNIYSTKYTSSTILYH